MDKIFPVCLTIFILGILGLIGWGVYEAVTAPDTGYVIGHEYHPSWYSTDCTGTGTQANPKICTQTKHSEQFCLVLRADDGNEGEHCVDEKTYHDYQVGQHYPDPR
jgi:hypothetical protein